MSSVVQPHQKSEPASGTLSFREDILFEMPGNVGTLEAFLNWATSDEFPDRGRIDFLGGRLYIDMSGAELHSHETLKAAVAEALIPIVRGQKLGKLFFDSTRNAHHDSESGVQPDFLVCTYDSIRAGRVRFPATEQNSERCVLVEGSADLIVEIVSNSSVRKDTIELRHRYFAADVREYWILDARGSRLTIELLTRGKNNWLVAPPDADGYYRSEVLAKRVRIARVADPVGLPDYDVLIQE